MNGKNPFEIFKHVNLVSISIPVGVMIASAILSLHPTIRQALIGIMLLWFGYEAMTGFEFWR